MTRANPDPLPYDDQHVYLVRASVPIPVLPDTWLARRDWSHLLRSGSIVYTTKDYRITRGRLACAVEVAVKDPGDAGNAVSMTLHAMRFDVAWVQGHTHDQTLPPLRDARASARYLRTVKADKAEHERLWRKQHETRQQETRS